MSENNKVPFSTSISKVILKEFKIYARHKEYKLNELTEKAFTVVMEIGIEKLEEIIKENGTK